MDRKLLAQNIWRYALLLSILRQDLFQDLNGLTGDPVLMHGLHDDNSAGELLVVVPTEFHRADETIALLAQKSLDNLELTLYRPLTRRRLTSSGYLQIQAYLVDVTQEKLHKPSDNATNQSDELSKQDMELIDILWRQDMDIGMARETFETPLTHPAGFETSLTHPDGIETREAKISEMSKSTADEVVIRKKIDQDKQDALAAPPNVTYRYDEETGERFIVPDTSPTDLEENVPYTTEGAFDEALMALDESELLPLASTELKVIAVAPSFPMPEPDYAGSAPLYDSTISGATTCLNISTDSCDSYTQKDETDFLADIEIKDLLYYDGKSDSPSLPNGRELNSAPFTRDESTDSRSVDQTLDFSPFPSEDFFSELSSFDASTPRRDNIDTSGSTTGTTPSSESSHCFSSGVKGSATSFSDSYLTDDFSYDDHMFEFDKITVTSEPRREVLNPYLNYLNVLDQHRLCPPPPPPAPVPGLGTNSDNVPDVSSSDIDNTTYFNRFLDDNYSESENSTYALDKINEVSSKNDSYSEYSESSHNHTYNVPYDVYADRRSHSQFVISKEMSRSLAVTEQQQHVNHTYPLPSNISTEVYIPDSVYTTPKNLKPPITRPAPLSYSPTYDDSTASSSTTNTSSSSDSENSAYGAVTMFSAIQKPADIVKVAKLPKKKRDDAPELETDSSSSSSSFNTPTSLYDLSSSLEVTSDLLLSKAARKRRPNIVAGLPFSATQIVESRPDEFSRIITDPELTDEQIQVIKDIRKRGKNKIAAHNCRKRKVDVIDDLAEEVNDLEIKRTYLMKKDYIMTMEKKILQNKLEQLKAALKRDSITMGINFNPNARSLKEVQTVDPETSYKSRKNSMSGVHRPIMHEIFNNSIISSRCERDNKDERPIKKGRKTHQNKKNQQK